jgi:CBS domain-containing protein
MASVFDTQLHTFVKDRPVIWISSDETVESALRKLLDHKITGAPVLDGDRKVKGFVDYLDLMAFLVKTCTKPLTDVIQGESRKLTTDDMGMMKLRSKEFRMSKVLDTILSGDFESERSSHMIMYEDQDVREAIKAFSSGIHRILLLKRQNNQIAGILSQVDLLSALAQDPKMKQFQRPIGELQNKTTKLLMVPASNTAIDSFIYMYDNRLSSIAMVNEHKDRLLGNLSAADLRGAMDDFNLLLRSTMDYLGYSYKQSGRELGVVYAPPNTSLHQAIMMMQQYHIHRIYLAEQDMKPQAVISFTDMAKELMGLHA